MIDGVDCLILGGDSYSAPLNFPVYSDLLAERLGIPLYNLAVPGSSNDRILRSTLEKFNEISNTHRKPMVIIGWSFLHRIEVWYHGPNEKIISCAPDQPNNGTQLRLMTLDWIPDNEINSDIKKSLISVDSIDKKITDWYLHTYMLSEFFKSKNTPYWFFSAADNTDFPIRSFPALQHFSFVRQIESDPNIYNLGKFCMRDWAKENDPECKPTGHLSENGHRAFANFLLDKIL